MKKFRLLRADEIDARVQSCTEKGALVLLYKDARCDMNILDEVVGCYNWQREHTFKDGKLYCKVSIYDADNKVWVSKEDVGTESNTEQEKGQASDSFKRACVNWGIGRELYSAPFIFIPAGLVKLTCTEWQGKKKYSTYDKFTVKEISYNQDESIKAVTLVDKYGNVVYPTQKSGNQEPQNQKPQFANAVEEISWYWYQGGAYKELIDKTRGKDKISALTPECQQTLVNALRGLK